MRLMPALKMVVSSTVFLLVVVLSGGLSNAAGDVSPEQLLLKLSELPLGTQVMIQSPLTLGSWANGMVNKDGTDIVQGYIAGARTEFMAPIGQTESTDGTQSTVSSYVANFAYRFADEEAAASEFRRLKDAFSSFTLVSTPKSVDSPGRQSVTFEIGGDSEVPYATMRWLFVQRGKFLIVLAMPGPLQTSAPGPAKEGVDLPLTAQAIDDYNRAIDGLFAANMALLQSR